MLAVSGVVLPAGLVAAAAALAAVGGAARCGCCNAAPRAGSSRGARSASWLLGVLPPTRGLGVAQRGGAANVGTELLLAVGAGSAVGGAGVGRCSPYETAGERVPDSDTLEVAPLEPAAVLLETDGLGVVAGGEVPLSPKADSRKALSRLCKGNESELLSSDAPADESLAAAAIGSLTAGGAVMAAEGAAKGGGLGKAFCGSALLKKVGEEPLLELLTLGSGAVGDTAAGDLLGLETGAAVARVEGRGTSFFGVGLGVPNRVCPRSLKKPPLELWARAALGRVLSIQTRTAVKSIAWRISLPADGP